MTYNDLLHHYKNKLDNTEITYQTIKLLLLELCNENDIDLYLAIDTNIDPKIEQLFISGFNRLLNNEPLNYILGFSWFCGNKLIVNDNVLVPRYETEELVYQVLGLIDEKFSDTTTLNLVDIGTGSGAIAISLAKEEPKLKVSASDISNEAINVALSNAKTNNVNIDFKVGNMLDPFINEEKFDILVSNPPYIPSLEVIDSSVKDFEPNIALFGGDDGLKFYQEIISNAHKIVNEKAIIAFEIGWDQKERLEKIAKLEFPNANIYTKKDINNKDRMLFIEIL